LLQDQFPNKPWTVLYDANSVWAQSEAQVYQPRAAHMVVLDNIADLSDRLMEISQKVEVGTPLVVLSPDMNLFERLPLLPQNPIVVGDVFAMANLTAASNFALETQDLYAIVSDPDMLEHYALSYSVFGRLVNTDLLNLVGALQYAL